MEQGQKLLESMRPNIEKSSSKSGMFNGHAQKFRRGCCEGSNLHRLGDDDDDDTTMMHLARTAYPPFLQCI